MGLWLVMLGLMALFGATFLSAYRRSPTRFGLPPFPVWFLWSVRVAVVVVASLFGFVAAGSVKLDVGLRRPTWLVIVGLVALTTISFTWWALLGRAAVKARWRYAVLAGVAILVGLAATTAALEF